MSSKEIDAGLVREVVAARAARSDAAARVKAAEGAVWKAIGGREGDVDTVTVDGRVAMARSGGQVETVEQVDADLLVALLERSAAGRRFLARATVQIEKRSRVRWDTAAAAEAALVVAAA